MRHWPVGRHEDGGVEARVYGTMPVRGSPGAEILAVLSDQQQGCSLLWRVAPAFTPCSKPSPQFDFRPSIKGCFYLISHLALWLTITASRPPTVS